MSFQHTWDLLAPFEILHADRLEHAISLPVLHFNVLHTQGLSARPQSIELLVKQVDLVGILEFLEDCQLLGSHGRFHVQTELVVHVGV